MQSKQKQQQPVGAPNGKSAKFKERRSAPDVQDALDAIEEALRQDEDEEEDSYRDSGCCGCGC